MIQKIVLLLFTLSSLSFAQLYSDAFKNESNLSLQNTLANDGLLSINKTFDVLTSPLSFDKNDFLMTSIIFSLTGASFSLDNRIRNDALNSKSTNLDNITYYGEKFGRPIYATILSGLLYSSGLLFKDNGIKETGQILLESMICTGIYTQLLKVSLGRARPYTGETNTELDLFEFEIESEDNSLPSGHTSIAFTVATVLSERIDNIFASVALYSFASLTAYQRVYSDVHWFSDTILGAALGTFIGLKLVKLHENSSNEKDDGFRINIFPQIDSQRYGFGVAMQL